MSPDMKRGTHPLHIRSFLKEPEKGFSCVPWLDALLIGFGLMLLSSKFLFAPGVAIELPRLDARLAGVSTSAVLSLRHDHLIIFDNRVFNLETLEAYWLGDWKKELPEDASPVPLLIKADEHVSMGVFLYVCELAQRSGFTQVQVASGELGSSLKGASLIDFDS